MYQNVQLSYKTFVRLISVEENPPFYHQKFVIEIFINKFVTVWSLNYGDKKICYQMTTEYFNVIFF